MKRDPAIVALLSAVSCLITVADAIRLRIGAEHSGDISGVLTDVNHLLEGAIAADGFRIDETLRPVGGVPSINGPVWVPCNIH